MKSLIPVLVLGSMLFVCQPVFCQDVPKSADPPQSKTQADKTAPFMRAKLVGSQDVLDGLVTENFGLIRRGAENMKTMSEAVQWPRSEDKIYEHYGEEFRRQCDKLIQTCDEKDLQVAHYTYLHMTTTCIQCHNYVRGAFRVERDDSNPQGPIRLIPTEWDGPTYRKDRSAKSGKTGPTR